MERRLRRVKRGVWEWLKEWSGVEESEEGIVWEWLKEWRGG